MVTEQKVTNIQKSAENAKVVYLTTEKALNVAQAATISVVPQGANNAEINIKDVAGNKLALGEVTASTAVVGEKIIDSISVIDENPL